MNKKTAGKLLVFLVTAGMLLGAGCSLEPPAATPVPHRPEEHVIVLVHGWQGLAQGYACADEPIEYEAGVDSPLGSLPAWFADAGYRVWIAYYQTGRSGTPALEVNAACLKKQLEFAHSASRKPIVIIAHSMGGLVSRAAIRLLDSETGVVSALYTLGSPHAGLPISLVAKFPGVFCQSQAALCQMDSRKMPEFNQKYPNRDGVAYTFIGGYRSNGLWGRLVTGLSGANDGLVGSYSAVGVRNKTADVDPPGWAQPLEGMFWSDETHGLLFGNYPYDYPREGELSYAFACIRALLAGSSPSEQACQVARPGPVAASQAAQAQFTAVEEVALDSANLERAAVFPIDSTPGEDGLIVVFWETGTPAISLLSAGQDVSSAESLADSYLAGGPDFPPAFVYEFSGEQAGQWTVGLQSDAPLRARVFALVFSDRILSVSSSKDVYTPADEGILLQASLTAGGDEVAAASVQATIEGAEGKPVDLVFGKDGYTGSLPLPAEPGLYLITVVARAEKDGISFTRQTELVIELRAAEEQ